MNSLEFAYRHIQEHLAKIKHPVIFELGVCDGRHTEMLLSWCTSEPDYYGFEPDPRNIERLTLTKSVSFHAAAVGNVTGKISFHLSTMQPTGGVEQSSISGFNPVLTEKWPWLKHDSTIEVQSWRLDDFCANGYIDHIDFLWMDVQGAERLVFDGATEMLPRTRLIWTEYDDGSRLYKDSSTRDEIIENLPAWRVIADCGNDVLLENPHLTEFGS